MTVKHHWRGDELVAAAERAAATALKYTAAAIIQEAKREAPKFTGQLANSLMMSEIEKHGNKVGLDIGFIGGHEEVFRYAMAVEKGRKPGKRPPTSALRLWVERVLGAGRTWAGKGEGAGYKRAGSKRMKDLYSREKEIASLAFLVARAIGKHGTKPHPFLLPAFDHNKRKLMPAFKRALNTELSELKGRAA